MKTRNGFVSNSSSSSFIVMTSKENYDKVLAGSDSYIRAMMKGMSVSEHKFLGRDVVSFGIFNGMGGEGTLDWICIDEEIPEDAEYNYPSCAFDKFVKALGPDVVCESAGDD